jgi:hypothetical protein
VHIHLRFCHVCGSMVSRPKCPSVIFFKNLKKLGHIVSADGMKPDPSKVQAVVNWPIPQTAFEVWSFLGLANYLVTPLNNLLKGLSQCNVSFNLRTLKRVLKVKATSKAPPKTRLCKRPQLACTGKYGEHAGQSQLAMHSGARRDSESKPTSEATPRPLHSTNESDPRTNPSKR